MPKELPGFYYDAEKNRYFPIKGPIPGGSSRKPHSSSSSSSSSVAGQRGVSNSDKKVHKVHKCMKIVSSNLLLYRELCGNLISSSRGKLNFQVEYQKKQASQPLIWKYHGTHNMSFTAIEQIHVDVNTPAGPSGMDILLSGNGGGSLCLFELQKIQQEFNDGINLMPERVYPINKGLESGVADLPGYICRGACIYMPSDISCIKGPQKHVPLVDSTSTNHVLFTTLGSERSGGSVYILNLTETLDFSAPMSRRINKISSFKHTVWVADWNTSGTRAAVGTNRGSALVNIETGRTSWVYHCSSDVLSLQIDHSGRILLCGLRNGAIVTVDARQKAANISAQLSSRGSLNHSHGSSGEKVRQNRHTMAMPSSISCLVSLKLQDQYFLASSMDGVIELYDHRLLGKGAVQSYEGNVNSHTRIQLGVDPSERVVMSGGEDCYVRLWSIKSGELLFEDKFLNSVPSVVCWPKDKEFSGIYSETQVHRDYWQDHHWGAWLGSHGGLLYMDWF